MFTAKLATYNLLGELPDPFLMDSGKRVESLEDWKKQRERLYRYAVDFQYGGMPPEPDVFDVEILDETVKLCTYRIIAGTNAKQISFTMQTVMPPEKAEKYPVVIDGDGCFVYPYDSEFIKAFTDIGIMLVRFNRTELVSDRRVIHTDGLYNIYPDMHFTALAAWAWGYKRCTDALIRLGIVDERYIAFTGHSRGAKTSLLAGAVDDRATIVNANASCSGGGACYRVHSSMLCEDGVERPSSTLEKMSLFPDWFTPEVLALAGKESELPFDTHYLKALIAPRTLLLTEAVSDAWGNPPGVHVTQQAAKEVWKFLGAEEKILTHYRNGYHYHSPDDARILANVMAHEMEKADLDPSINASPFDELPKAYSWACPDRLQCKSENQHFSFSQSEAPNKSVDRILDRGKNEGVKL